MSANVSNLFVSTLGGKTKANNYANRFFPPQVGLAKMPTNTTGLIDLPYVASFVSHMGGTCQAMTKALIMEKHLM